MAPYLLAMILVCLPIAACAPTANRGPKEVYDALQEDHADLLRGNFARCDLTVRIRIQAVSVHKELPPLYTVYEYRVEVVESYKGDPASVITYRHMMESPADRSFMAKQVGRSGIVSLFHDRESGAYEMGDNGYELPDTAHLVFVARKLAPEEGRGGSR